MRVFNRHVSIRSLTVFGFETLLISGSVMFAAQLHGTLDNALRDFSKVVIVTALCELCFYYNDLYDLTRVHAKSELLVGVLRGTGAAAIALGMLSVVVPSVLLGNGTFVTTVGLLLIAVPVWRLAFNGLTSDPDLKERILVVGTGTLAQTVARQIRTQHDFAYRIVGFVEDESGRGIGGTADLAHLIEAHRVDRVVVGLADRRGRLPIQELLHAKMAGVRVEDAATTYERLTGKILVDDLKPS